MNVSTVAWMERNPKIANEILALARDPSISGNWVHRDTINTILMSRYNLSTSLKPKITDIIQSYPEEFERWSGIGNVKNVHWVRRGSFA